MESNWAWVGLRLVDCNWAAVPNYSAKRKVPVEVDSRFEGDNYFGEDNWMTGGNQVGEDNSCFPMGRLGFGWEEDPIGYLGMEGHALDNSEEE
jgi:hypothetical protein